MVSAARAAHRPGSRRRERVSRAIAAVAALTLPERCVVCGRFGAALHDACVVTLARAGRPRCLVCWQPSAAVRCADCGPGAGPSPVLAVDGMRACFRFEGHARRAVIEAKFRGISSLLPPLARAAAATLPCEWDPLVVVPVPLSRARQRRRGFNQAEVVAAVVAGALARPLATATVRRVRDTAPQSTLTAAERRRNLDGAFVASTPPERVLVVDDVTTTGTTLGAVARALRMAGARRVYGLTLARED